MLFKSSESPRGWAHSSRLNLQTGRTCFPHNLSCQHRPLHGYLCKHRQIMLARAAHVHDRSSLAWISVSGGSTKRGRASQPCRRPGRENGKLVCGLRDSQAWGLLWSITVGTVGPEALRANILSISRWDDSGGRSRQLSYQHPGTCV